MGKRWPIKAVSMTCCTYDERTLALAQALLLAGLSRRRGPLLLLRVHHAQTARGPTWPRDAGTGRRLHKETGRRAESEGARHQERRAHAEVRDHAGRRPHRSAAVAAEVHRLQRVIPTSGLSKGFSKGCLCFEQHET